VTINRRGDAARTTKSKFERKTNGMGKNGTVNLEVPVKGAFEPMGDLGRGGATEIASSLRSLLADVFTL
jgi:hypothetical protein